MTLMDTLTHEDNQAVWWLLNLSLSALLMLNAASQYELFLVEGTAASIKYCC